MVNDPASGSASTHHAEETARATATAPGAAAAPEQPALADDAGHGRVALVSDVSSPIGAAVASELLRLGCEVWGLEPPRTPPATGEPVASLRAAGVHVIRVAGVDDAHLESAVAQVGDAAGHIDVLVNTLGDPGHGSIVAAGLDDVRHQFDVSVLAPVRLAQLVLPGMRQRAYGRIVLVTGLGGSLVQASGAWQHSMGAAVAAMGENLRLEVAPFDVKVSLVEPGPLTTEWAARARRGLEERGRGTAYEQPLGQVARFMRRFEGGRFTSSSQSVARVVAQAALSDAPLPRYEVGVGSGATAKVRQMVKDRAVSSLLDALG